MNHIARNIPAGRESSNAIANCRLPIRRGYKSSETFDVSNFVSADYADYAGKKLRKPLLNTPQMHRRDSNTTNALRVPLMR
jgi:hypothetical protein